MKQTELALGVEYKSRREHGGDTRERRRKLRRPFDPKSPLHITMRSSRAKDRWSMLRTTERERAISRLVYRYAHKNGVTVHRFANAGNHLHLLVRARRHAGLKNFLRTVGALVPRIVTGAKKGNPVGKFWDALAYSRIVAWGRDFTRVALYVAQNAAEGSVASDSFRRHKFYLEPA